jgi:peptide/nickel transport system substrate-binding protein
MEITLARNEKYWKEKPHIMKRVFRFITNANAACQVLERQEMDYMNFQVSPELWVTRASKPEFEAKFNKYKYYGSSYSYVGWNLRHTQFQDKMVRRALTMLLDRKLILETIYYGLGKQVTGEFFVESPEYDASIQPWPFDPEQARQLLDGAGWKDTDGDGIRDKGGTPFQFELLTRAGSPEDDQIATVYQEELKRAGIQMTIRSLEWATFLERVDSRNYDAVRLAWSQPFIEGDPYQVWHSSQADKGSNFVGFKNNEADRIMEQARLEFDQAKRVAMYHRFDAILHDEQPYTFLFCIQELEALDKRFAGVKVYKFGLDSREWWVPANLQRYH